MGNVIQLFPAPTAAANLNTSTVAQALTLHGGSSGASGLAGVAASGAAAASLWAIPATLCAAVEQQASHVDAAIAMRSNTIAGTNDRALTDMMNMNEQNRDDLTETPVVSV